MAVCFFGEGALGQGVLYEVMNIAALWKLPVIYVCENNMYNEYTHYSETTAGDILARPAAFGIPAESVDGQDVRAVYEVASRLVDRARAGKGPAFLLCNTYRYRGHHVGDVNREYYRAKQEEQKWMTERDPIKLLGELLIAERLADQPALDAFTAEVRSEMDAAVDFAIKAPYPRRGSGAGGRVCLRSRSRELTIGRSHPEALAEEMRRDPRVFIMGEDVAEAGTPFKVLSGLVEEFGKDRVSSIRRFPKPDSPASASGAAMTGLAPRGRHHVRRFHDADHGPDGQPGRQGSLHVRRQVESADGPAHHDGRHAAFGRAAFAIAARLVQPHSRPESRDAFDALRRQGPAEDRRFATTIPWSFSKTR